MYHLPSFFRFTVPLLPHGDFLPATFANQCSRIFLQSKCPVCRQLTTSKRWRWYIFPCQNRWFVCNFTKSCTVVSLP